MGEAANRISTPPVVIASGRTANSLGVVRGFGRHGVEVILVHATSESPVRFSGYVKRILRASPPRELNSNYLDILVEFGRGREQKPVIIPTGDEEVLYLAEHAQCLNQYFRFSLADCDLLQLLVNKHLFYQLLEKKGFAHPLTFFPEGFLDIEELSKDLTYPFLIKPSNSLAFQMRFRRKCFVVKNRRELKQAVQALTGSNLQVLLQEIIPGNEFYELYVYFDTLGNPIAQCGWDRLRQFPPGFGNGTCCRSVLRREPSNLGISLLQRIGFRGLAAIEFILDPRDGQFKMIEVNPRTTLQNRLSAGCGVDMEWIAYLDILGENVGDVYSPTTGAFWVDDLTDVVSHLHQMSLGNFLRIPRNAQKIRSFAWFDDPLPLFARVVFLFLNMMRLLHLRLKSKISDTLARLSLTRN